MPGPCWRSEFSQPAATLGPQPQLRRLGVVSEVMSRSASGFGSASFALLTTTRSSGEQSTRAPAPFNAPARAGAGRMIAQRSQARRRRYVERVDPPHAGAERSLRSAAPDLSALKERTEIRGGARRLAPPRRGGRVRQWGRKFDLQRERVGVITSPA